MTALLAIIKTQVEDLNKGKDEVVALNTGEFDSLNQDLEQGMIKFLFGTPEVWVKNEKWCSLLRTEIYRKKTRCVPKWSV